MTDSAPTARPVDLSRGGPPEVVLPPDPPEVTAALARATTRDEVAEVVASAPASSTAWAALGSHTETPIDRYAAFRVGYHRGLDSLRAAGWRGSGFVRWSAPSNRGVLRCLLGLRNAAAALGETSEVERLDVFMQQLDPSWDRRDDDSEAER